MTIFESDSIFNIRDFVNESSVLLLSGAAPSYMKARYIDIKFVDVAYLDIPISLQGIRIRQVSDSQLLDSIFNSANAGKDIKQFVIESRNLEFTICSSGLSVYYVRADSLISSIRWELKWTKMITSV